MLFACIEELAHRERPPSPRRSTQRARQVLLKLACVVHRFGADIAGGSEGHCRLIAEHLAAQHDVTILTTCAKDHITWRNHYPAGEIAREAAGCAVLRFPVARERDMRRFMDLERSDRRRSRQRRGAGAVVPRERPDAPELLEHLRAPRRRLRPRAVLGLPLRRHLFRPAAGRRPRGAGADRRRGSADPRRRAGAVLRAAAGVPVPDAGRSRRWSAPRAGGQAVGDHRVRARSGAGRADVARSTRWGSPIRSCCISAGSIRTRAARP